MYKEKMKSGCAMPAGVCEQARNTFIIYNTITVSYSDIVT